MNTIIKSLIVLSIVLLISCVFTRASEGFATDDICTVSLTNINPMFVKNYQQYDGQKIKCFNKLSSKAYCLGATLKMDVKSIGTDADGTPLPGKQTVFITNSNGSDPPANAIIPIDPWEFPNFFCLS